LLSTNSRLGQTGQPFARSLHVADFQEILIRLLLQFVVGNLNFHGRRFAIQLQFNRQSSGGRIQPQTRCASERREDLSVEIRKRALLDQPVFGVRKKLMWKSSGVAGDPAAAHHQIVLIKHGGLTGRNRALRRVQFHFRAIAPERRNRC